MSTTKNPRIVWRIDHDLGVYFCKVGSSTVFADQLLSGDWVAYDATESIMVQHRNRNAAARAVAAADEVLP